MSWLEPSNFETALFEEQKHAERLSREVIELARLVSLVPRVEPRLLRNLRLRWLPASEPEIEYRLWFSEIVSARSTRDIVIHHGVARLLADELQQDEKKLADVWTDTQSNTRHWPPLERLERDLRFHALRKDSKIVGLQQRQRHSRYLRGGIQDVLRLLKALPPDDTDTALACARWAKKVLPVVNKGATAELTELRLLAQFAARALGATGEWTRISGRSPLPDWLPQTTPGTGRGAELAVSVHQDPGGAPVIEFAAPGDAESVLAFSSALPALIHVTGVGDTTEWRTVTEGSRIKLQKGVNAIHLTTIDGYRYKLRFEGLSDSRLTADKAPEKIYLTYVEKDGEQAKRIQEWLSEHDIQVKLRIETATSAAASGPLQPSERLIRLWTGAAQAYWAGRPEGRPGAEKHTLMLRTEPVALPERANAPEILNTLDWIDWQKRPGLPDVSDMLEPLRQWLEEAPGKSTAEWDGDSPDETKKLDRDRDIAALLKEIEDPAIEPPRRLEIGDRLAELGDPRPGVGVREIEVPLEAEEGPASAEPGATAPETSDYPEAISKLLEEITDPATEPPRRLEIGDELDRLGDPRKGVGLDDNGLPDIDWVEIPAGAFIYQDGETRELPTFWISRYPITNRQYQSFIDAGGYDEPQGIIRKVLEEVGSKARAKGQWWRGLKQPKPALSQWPQSNRPRTDVDWYEAVAFSRWLSVQLTGEEGAIRLPAEEEWEKAARGAKGLMYPWGREYQSGYANISETRTDVGPWYLEQTTAVGLYPHGRSPYQVQDLSGTVWEWCLNKYDKSEVIEADASGDLRVLRGGSWVDGPDFARADLRYGDLPESRDLNRGFRVVSSVHIARAFRLAGACRPRSAGRREGPFNGAGASGPHARHRTYIKKRCHLDSFPWHLASTVGTPLSGVVLAFEPTTEQACPSGSRA